MQAGAVVYGSPSTANVVVGFGLTSNRVRIIQDGDVVNIGKFKIQVFETPHSPNAKLQGKIKKPIQFPAKGDAFLQGKAYLFLIANGKSRTLVVPSANFIPGKFHGLKVDTIFLATGSMGVQPKEWVEKYWDETVVATGARRVIPIHWDDFGEPLEDGLKPLPAALDDFGAGMSMITALAKRDDGR